MMAFGQRLKALRVDRGQSQAVVAQATGFTQTNLSALERRDTIPRESVVQKLAAYYNVPVTYFYETEKQQQAGRNQIDLAKEYLRELIRRAE